MKALPYIAMITSFLVLVACSEPPQPRSVSTFIEHPILLEAALIRCTQNRDESRYDPECVNAREAVRLLQAEDDEAHRAELEARSQRKRDALRRTQRAATEARRRATEAQRRREEAEYLAQFGELPPRAVEEIDNTTGNMPLAVIPEAENDDVTLNSGGGSLPTIGSNAPTAELTPVEDPVSDIDSIRDELRRRNDEDKQ
jgi:hypothetical protein